MPCVTHVLTRCAATPSLPLPQAYQVGGKVGLLGSKWTPAEQLNRYAAHEVTRRAAHLQKEQARLARKAAAKAKRKGGDGDDEGPADYDERRRRRRR